MRSHPGETRGFDPRSLERFSDADKGGLAAASEASRRASDGDSPTFEEVYRLRNEQNVVSRARERASERDTYAAHSYVCRGATRASGPRRLAGRSGGRALTSCYADVK